MKTLLFYLLQVIVTSGILYSYYHFALRNKRFHRYNRFFLLAATFVSITVPFLNIPVYFTQSATNSSVVLETLTFISSAGTGNSIVAVTHAGTQPNLFTWENLSWIFYSLVASLLFIRIILSLLKIRRIVKNNPVKHLNKIHFVNTTEPGTPFSFFRWLFWNKKIELHSEKGEQIFRHEVYHIEQKHSWDIIYAGILNVIFWINPFFHLMKKELRAIHEFLADQYAVSENSKWEYAELLLMQVLNTNQQLVNPFFHNQIKRRITMITSSNKPGHQYLRKLMILPVSGIVIGLFAFSYKKKQEESLQQKQLAIDNFKQRSDTTPTINAIVPGATVSFRQQEPKPDSTYRVKIDGKTFSVISDTTTQPLFVLDGKKQDPGNELLKKLDPNIIERIDVLKGPQAIEKYGELGKNGVIEIITKKENSNRTGPITQEEIKQDGTDNKIFDKVEIEPSFPGGSEKWKQYLERNLDVTVPTKKKAPNGVYTVVVQFIVDKEGNISDVKALTNHEFGMEEEALRVIKAGPRWVPAMQNGRIVKAYKRQAITFVIGKGDKNFPSNATTSENIYSEVVVVGFPSTTKTDNKIFDNSETRPSFPGGDSAWRRYLIRNCNSRIPVDSGAPAGTYKVVVQFIVREDGNLESIRSTTNHGYGMENEAMRLIKKGPPWIPAKQNGRNVRAYVQQPVTFQVEEETDISKVKPIIK